MTRPLALISLCRVPGSTNRNCGMSIGKESARHALRPEIISSRQIWLTFALRLAGHDPGAVQLIDDLLSGKWLAWHLTFPFFYYPILT